MKMTKFLFFLHFGIIFPIFGQIDQGDALNDACSYLFLSQENINNLNSWDRSKEVFIGCDENKCRSNTLSTKHSLPNEWISRLTNISFEDEERSPQEKLVAERQSGMKSIGAQRDEWR